MWSLVAGIGGSVAKLFGFSQVKSKAAKIIGSAALIVAVVALFSLGKCAYDRSVVNEYQTEQRAVDAETALNADFIADQAERKRWADMEAENARMEEAASAAARADPVGAAKPVGPVSQSYYDNLPQKKGTDR